MSAQPRCEVERGEPASAIELARNRLDLDTLDPDTLPVVGGRPRLVWELGRRTLLVDLGEVGRLSAAALGKLVALHSELRGMGVHLELCNVRPAVCELFRLTRLSELLDIRPGAER
jgi:ABC-type transporter Mla MlaB component